MNGIRPTKTRSEDRQGSRTGSEFTALAKTIRAQGLLRRRYTCPLVEQRRYITAVPQ